VAAAQGLSVTGRHLFSVPYNTTPIVHSETLLPNHPI
jgi:hypothetical protein